MRVSTLQTQQSAILNLQRAQQREQAAGQEVASGKRGDDLKAFGRGAESVAALKSVAARVDGWRAQTDQVSGRLEMQDLMLNRLMDSAADARAAIGAALANDRGEGVMTELGGAFAKASGALNAQHEGKPLFAGARLDEAPLAADSLSDLTAAATVPELFRNDSLKSSVRLGENTVVQTGELADDIGTELVTVFRDLQTFAEGPDGTLGHPLTQTQKNQLTALMQRFAGAEDGVREVVARNGSVQRRVDDLAVDLGVRAKSLSGLIGDRTEVDMAEAVSKLQQAGIAVQASAQVFATLRGTSLLELLR